MPAGIAGASGPAAGDEAGFGDGRLLRTAELTPARFPGAADGLRQQLRSGEHRLLSPAQKQRIEVSLIAIQAELDGDRPSAGNRIARHQRRINELLVAPLSARHAGSELVCQRQKRVGTNIPETRCITREEAENEREAARWMITGVGSGCDQNVGPNDSLAGNVGCLNR